MLRRFKSKMKVLIVTPFYDNNHNISRPSFVRKTLIEAGVNIKLLTADFSHTKKENIEPPNVDYCALSTIKYKSNTSILRFVSHFVLAVKFFTFLVGNHKKFDKVYITLPFGFTAFLFSFLAKDKLIVDIVDLWPNSLPFNIKLTKMAFFIFKPWLWLNIIACKRASKVMSLSSTFLKQTDCYSLEGHILLGAKNKVQNLAPCNRVNRILYIGNIGALYDFESLIFALSNLSQLITVDIVGDGDRRDWLLKELESNQIPYCYHGLVYDEDTLIKIAENCTIGFNGFKGTTASFSYKAISYFSFGLPIINSMKGDMWGFVEKNSLGFNFRDKDELTSKLAIWLSNDVEIPYSKVSDFFDANLDEVTISNKIKKIFI